MLEISSLLTIVAATAEHSEESAGGIAALGIDPIAILAQAGTFLVLFFIIRKFALGKIVSTLENRRRTIDDGVTLGLELREQKAQLDQHVAKLMHDARVEADRVIAASHQEASGVIKQAEVTAAHKVDTMLADAKAKIEDETAKARKGLEGEITVLVAEVAERVIGEKMTAEKDTSLIKRALQGISR